MHKLNFSLPRLIIILIILFISSGYLNSQNYNSTDTLKNSIESINVSEIPIKSGDIIIEYQRIQESIISALEIENRARQTDSILLIIDSLMILDRSLDIRLETTRYLSNRMVFWKNFADYLNKEKKSLAKVLGVLSGYEIKLEEDIKVWKNTEDILSKDENQSTLLHRVVDVLEILNSVKSILFDKSEDLLIILNNTSERSIKVEEFINVLDHTYLDKKSEIFVRNEPSIFTIDYKDPDKRSLIKPLKNFYKTEFSELVVFLKKEILEGILQLLLLIGLIFIFNEIKFKILKTDIVGNSIYSRMLLKIMSRSVSAALIIGVFANFIIFKERPELFKDILVLIISVPIIIIARTIVPRGFYKYTYLFGIVIILSMVYFIFPPDNMYFMILMLLIALIEIFVLYKLTIYFYHNPYNQRLYNLSIFLILLVHLGFALTGFLALLLGSTTLAEVTLRIPVTNAFNALLIFSIVIIINGFISFGVETNYAKKLNVIRLYGEIIKRRAISLVNLIFFIFWIQTILNVINIKRVVIDSITAFLQDPINIGSASFTPGNIIMFFLVIWLSIVLSRIIQILLEKDILYRLNLAKGIPNTIAVMVKYSLVTIGVLLAISAAGMPLSSLTVLAGAFGVGIGFGLQHIFNNIVSGFILLLERPIQIGDTVEVGQLIGNVKTIGIRASCIRTFEGAEVIVPNGQLISNDVVNWTLSDQKRRIEIFTGVAYGSDPHLVKKLFEKVLKDHTDIIDDPAPKVYFKGLGDSALEFRLLFWTSNYPDWIRIQSEIVFAIHDVLYKEGISIPFPQMDLHFKSIDKSFDFGDKSKDETK